MFTLQWLYISLGTIKFSVTAIAAPALRNAADILRLAFLN